MEQKIRDRAYRSGKETAETLLSMRRYSVLVTIVEVFLRKNMGERYFNGRNFAGGLLGLILYRFLLSFFNGNSQAYLGDTSFNRIHYFDLFIGLYILFALYQFILQWRSRAARKSYYSYFLGQSRLAFVAKGLGFKDYAYVTYKVTEPLMVLLCAVPVLSYSLFLAILTVIAAGRLWWENSKVLAQEWHHHLDRQDSEIYANHIRKSMTDIDDSKVKTPPTPSSLKASERRQRTVPKTSEVKTIPSVEEALQNLNPKLKHLGNQDSLTK